MVKYMKKKVIVAILAVLLFGCINVHAQISDIVVSFEDVTSLNFVERTQNYNIERIKKICTYDYCDYIKGSDKLSSIEIFTKNYLKSFDKETAAILKVKGIRITNIVLN